MEKTSGLVAESGPDHPFSRFIADTEQWIKNVIGVPEEDYEEDIVGPDVDPQIHRLNTMWRRLQEDEITQRLEASAGIQEQTDVEVVMGQERIELVNTSIRPHRILLIALFSR